jgi:hypothetical protein
MNFQRGGFALGLVAGLLIGLALALGVALYITKAPNPFVNKVPQRTAEQDIAETERNRTWDPNAPLGGKPVARPGRRRLGCRGGGFGVCCPALRRRLQRRPHPACHCAANGQGSGCHPGGWQWQGCFGAQRLSSRPSGTAAPAVDAFVYFVQAGAFTRSDDAEQQRARLALLGLSAKITEREQAGRTMYRVRMGPFPMRDEADRLQARLLEQTIESQIVRVEKP